MEKTEKLTPKEIKQIKSYCVLPRLALPSLLGLILMMVLWLLLTMINDIALDAHYTPYTTVILGCLLFFFIVDIIFFSCAVLIPRCGMNGKKWRNILSKLEVYQQQIGGTEAAALGVTMGLSGNMLRRSSNETISGIGTAAQIAGAAASAATIHQMTSDVARNARAVAEAWGIPVPSYKKYKLTLLLLPSLVMTILFIPAFMHSSEAKEQKAQIVTQTMEQLTAAFTTDTRSIYSDDPYEYSKSSYNFSCHEKDDPAQRYMYIDVSETGVITNISWHMYEDASLSREENLAQLRAYVLKTEEELKASHAPIWTPSFNAGNAMQGELVQECMDASQQDGSFTSIKDENTRYTLRYSTESSDNYFYYSISEN